MQIAVYPQIAESNCDRLPHLDGLSDMSVAVIVNFVSNNFHFAALLEMSHSKKEIQ
jgi:hypothetical protein